MFRSTRLFPVIIVLLLVDGYLYAQTSSRSPRPPAISGQITGQVRIATGSKPAEQVLITLEAFSGGIIDQVRTDGTGKFRFTGLQPTLFWISVRHPGFEEIRQQVDLRTIDRDFIQLQLNPERVEKVHPLTSSKIFDARIPPEAQHEFEKGQTAVLEHKNVQSGIAHLEKAVNLYPQFLEAHLLLGTLYMDIHQWEKAEHELRRTLEINSNIAPAYFALGEVYWQKKKFVEAEKALQDGIKLEPRSHQGHFILGQVYFAEGDLGKAGPEVGQAIQLNPNFAEAYVLAGNLFLRARKAENALQMFEQYLRLEPNGHLAAQTHEIIEKIKNAMSEKKE